MTDFTLPDSVHAYLTERGVQTAVDALVGKTLERKPPVEWEDLPRFYDALLATTQVQVDWAKASVALWSAVWGNGPEGWVSCSVADQSLAGWTTNSVLDCWDDSQFVCAFRRGSDLLFTSISFDEGAFFAGISASKKTPSGLRDLRLAAADFTFDDDPDAMALWCADTVCPFAQTPDLEPLRAAARTLVGIAEAALRGA